MTYLILLGLIGNWFFQDGEDESEEEDTEFEDEVKLPMPIQDNKARIQAIEETRQFLEQNLGPKNFLQAYPAIQVIWIIDDTNLQLFIVSH